MIELRFHQDLYDGFAVDEAVKTYAPYAATELSREADAFVVRLTANDAATADGLGEALIARELLNFALGLTIERHRAPVTSSAAAPPATPEGRA